ncbi:unnamed protein product [Mytilus coruscus]|uniref:Snake toxin/toxin-like domain-containing protein n=1 Tax=Mytilus coruscus TaxID=42192 RepID=A0A6J8DPR9_MYTCO|nr:unnamed protein product [Mytilus coruscus]
MCCIFHLDLAFQVGNVQSFCKDVDQTACGVFKTADPKMCDNPCLADICKETCGFCPLMCYHCDNVARQEDCTTKVQCNLASEICIATQRFNTQLQPVFSSGCVNKAVCKTLFNYGGTTGKRAYTLHGGCCATDLCNVHDPDGNFTSSDTEFNANNEQDHVVQEDADSDPDTCEDFDRNNIACGILHKQNPAICKKDCVGRKICPETCGTCVRCKTCPEVDDPAHCNNISICKKTQSCFSRNKLRDDFTLAHELGCMDDFICHAYFGGIIDVKINKRQFGGNIRIGGQCCKTNVCNANGMVSPTAPTIVILAPEVNGICDDVDSTACGMLLAVNSKMCINPCLAQICRGTCGVCSLDCIFCDSVSRKAECYATVQCKPQSESFFEEKSRNTFYARLIQICKTLFSSNSSTALNHNHTLTVFDGLCCGTDLCNKDPDANITSDVLFRCKTCRDIADPALCNNITLCKKSQSCFSKERLNIDFTILHDLSCMDDVICHAYFGGIHDNNITKTQSSFSVSGQCCKSNLCNAKGTVLKTPAIG